MRKIETLAACVLLLSALFIAAQAQQPTATLSGVVKDPRGDLISGARVSVKHKSTGIERDATTGEEGTYIFPNLAVGEYLVKAEAMNFARQLEVTLLLRVGQNATLDLTLDPTGPTEVVTLHDLDSAVEVNTTSAVVDGVITERAIENLPLNGRNFLELALLVPGNSPAPNFDPTKTNSVAVSSAGQFGRGGNIRLDGLDNNDDVVGGVLQNMTQEAVQEFQIATNRFSAEYGRSASSVINIVTKAGTNELHGSASVFLRDHRLQGLPATFDRSSGAEEPPFDRQQYAFALGGPFKRDRAWWFGAFEYRNQDGAVLVGARDPLRRRITRGFALAPLDDLLGTLRADWHPSTPDTLSVRYSLERAEDVAASTLIRAIGSASQRQSSRNNYHSALGNWTHIFSPKMLNDLRVGWSDYLNRTEPVAQGPQLTFPSLQDGSSFRVPQQTEQRRFQLTDALTWIRGAHTLRMGGEAQRIDAGFDLGVFREGRLEFVQDFPDFDHNGDGRTDDQDLLFAVTLRSAVPERSLVIPDADNTYFAFFLQDDWRIHPQLTLNLGLRYELDTDVKNVSRTSELNPLILPFLRGERGRDTNNWGPRFGFNWATRDGTASVHGGYGIYYDRVTLELQSLERGLDGRALPIAVRAGNTFFLDPQTGQFPPFAPTVSNPFTGFILAGAGASGINIIDNGLQNPVVQQMNLGVARQLGTDFVLRADYVHNHGTHFITGRTVGTVFNPVVGGPDRVVNLESSVGTKYDGLLVSFEKRYSRGYQLRASYTLSKAFNYANDDQIPFSNGPIDPNNLRLEYGPTPNDQRHRFTFSGVFDAPYGLRFAPILTLASGVPMDILLPDGLSRIPTLQRNAGGRLFHTGAELNAFLTQLNASGAMATPLPFVRDDARFSDSFSSLDFRLSRPFIFGDAVRLEPIVEVFNLFNVTNVLGVSNVNYSGFSNVLVRDSNDPADPGFLRSSGFGRAITTAGGVFGSGGPRAFQFAVRVSF